MCFFRSFQHGGVGSTLDQAFRVSPLPAEVRAPLDARLRPHQPGRSLVRARGTPLRS